MFSRNDVRCCICQEGMDYQQRYGRESCCCSQACWNEFEWRQTLSILGKEYYPDPKKETKPT